MTWNHQLLIISAIFFVSGNPVFAQESTEVGPYDRISAVLTEFVQAADASDVATLEGVLHPTFRVAINQFRGSADVTVLDRPVYLKMISEGKLGGEPRQMEIQSIEWQGHLAFAKVRTEGSAVIIDSHYTLMQDPAGKWWVTSDVPLVTAK